MMLRVLRWALLLGSRRSSSGDQVFLNIVLTDKTPEGAALKAKSFFCLIDRCVRERERVRVVVPAIVDDAEKIASIYRPIFSRYSDSALVQLVVVPRRSQIARYFELALLFLVYCVRGSNVTGRNTAFVLATQYQRIMMFERLFDRFPCRHWIGLTGNLELPTFKARAMELGVQTQVSAMQFGVSSADQTHYDGYRVDRLFVYDALSAANFLSLGVDVGDITVCGSPEFEYYAGTAMPPNCNENQVRILFIDQPVWQRPEYPSEYLSRVREMLDRVVSMDYVAFTVRPHPRGSAFGGTALPNAFIEENAYQQILGADIVIGFFSNLCDLAALGGRATICLGAGRVLSEEKVAALRALGVHVFDDVMEASLWIEETVGAVAEGRRAETVRAAKIAHASEIIFEKWRHCDA